MTTGLSAGIYGREEKPKVRQIQGVSTSIAAFVGLTERGPIGVATRTTSWAEWVSIFGGFTANSDLPQSVYAAYLGGAREVVTVRTVHYSDINNGASYTATKASGAVLNAGAGSANAQIYSRAKAPFSLANGQTLILNKNGVAQPTLTFSATRAIATSASTATQDMSGGKTLLVKVNSGEEQTVSFVDGDFATPSAATANEVAFVINKYLSGARAYNDGSNHVVIESDRLGSSSKIEVTGGTAQALWSWPATTSGTGNVSDIGAVTIAEIKSLLEALISDISVSDDGESRLLIEHDETGTSKTLQVDSSSTADTPMLLDNSVHTGLDSAGGKAKKTSTNTAPFVFSPSDTLDVSIDGAGAITTTFTATRASVESGNAETQDMSGGKTLQIKVNDGATQTISFVDGDFGTPSAATAEEVVTAANKQLSGARFWLSSSGTKITIESDLAGTASKIEIVGGTAQTLWVWPTLAVGSGNVANIGAVTVEEIKLAVEALVAGVRIYEDATNHLVIERSDAGLTKTLNTPAGTAVTKIGLTTTVVAGTTGSPSTTGTLSGKTEGTYARSISALVEDATSGNAEEFNLTLLEAGVVLEFYANLTMGDYDGITDPEDVNYIELVLNDEEIGSSYLSFADAGIVGTATERRPANGTYTLTGGDDGLTSLADIDFLGSEAGANGLHALDNESDISILAVPGRATSSVHNGMITYAETYRSGKIFCVLDTPAGYTYQQAKTYVTSTAGLKNSTEYAAIYWPELLLTNPDQTVFGRSKTITIPPSGAVVGAYIRTDNARLGGVYDAPAGVERGRLPGIVGVADKSVNNEKVRDILYPENINPIHQPTGQVLHIDGSRVLNRNSNFPSISERRGVMFIEASLVEGLAFVKHSNNTPELREEVDRTTTNFLLNQMKLGAFATKDPDTAFFVDTGDALNPPSEQFAGRLNQRIGLATAKPAEFVNLIVSQDTRALEEEIAAAS